MDIENAPDHSQGSDQQTQAKDGPPPKEMALLERFLNRIGFFVPKYIVMYIIGLALCPFLLEYLICRRYCDIEDCRFYRNTASRCIEILLFLYHLRLRYLTWSRDRQDGRRSVPPWLLIVLTIITGRTLFFTPVS